MIPLYIKFQKKKLIYIDSDICNEDYSKEKRWTVKKTSNFRLWLYSLSMVMVIISSVCEYVKIYQNYALLNICSHCMSISIKLLKIKMIQENSCECVPFKLASSTVLMYHVSAIGTGLQNTFPSLHTGTLPRSRV